MSSVTFYVALFSLGLFFFYWKTIYDLLWRRIRIYKALHSIPGPFAVPLLGTVWQFKWKTEGVLPLYHKEELDLSMQFHEWTTYYRNRGHSLLKIWVGPIPTLFVMKPDAARTILESNTLITKGKEYDILIPWLGRGLLIATGDKWRTRRKMLTPSFHFNVLNDFLKVHDYQAKILVEQIDRFAVSGEQFDIFPWIKRCALDIICETAMGCTVSAQTNHSHPYVFSVQRMNELAFQYQRMPWLQIKPIWWLSGYGHAYERHLKVVTDFTKTVISDKLAQGEDELVVEGKKKAFLDMLVELSRDGSLSYEDIREEVDTFMFEGHDTTSASMGWTLWCLAHNPDCQRRIHQELDSVFGDTDRDITTDDLKQLKYLERCIKESLRVRPSVPNFARIVEEDTVIDGVCIPRGCSIIICPLMLHYSEDIWKDPFEFDPDRFVDENVARRHPYAYIPFSAGPRNCIGQKFALMEEKTVLAWFFRKYRISSAVPFVDNGPLPEIILRPALGLPVKIEKRESL